MEEKEIHVISSHKDYMCDSKENAVEAILHDYSIHDVYIGELLNSISITGVSIQDIVDIVARVMNIIEADELIQMQDVDSDTPIIIKRWEW